MTETQIQGKLVHGPYLITFVIIIARQAHFVIAAFFSGRTIHGIFHQQWVLWKFVFVFVSKIFTQHVFARIVEIYRISNMALKYDCNEELV